MPPWLRPRPRDAEEVLCLGLALDERYAEGCPERIGEDDPEGGCCLGASRRKNNAQDTQVGVRVLQLPLCIVILQTSIRGRKRPDEN